MNSDSPNKGIAYLRRSTEKQCESLPSQLDWAIAEAAKLGVHLHATHEDLERLIAEDRSEQNDLIIDNGISGADFDRPGFLSVQHRIEDDSGITHLFIMRRDRFARPEDAAKMVHVEQQISRRGITLVFVDVVLPPINRGESDFGRDVQTLYDYHQSGKYLNTLAELTIRGQRRNAVQGFSTGGHPPYGHDRVLVDRDGTIIEILTPGKVVRQKGLSVRWLPGMTDRTKAELKIWLLILQLYKEGWGITRIANHLTDAGIPSPSAGKYRKRSGVNRQLSSQWHAKTIRSFISNSIIVGEKRFGTQSNGRFRRLAAEGCRTLVDSDLSDRNRPKRILNEPAVVVAAPSGAEGLINKGEWLGLQAQLETRGKNQRGITRARDIDANPLCGHLFDLSPSCGEPMYCLSRPGKQVFGCSRYSRSNGRTCNRNAVDSEPLLKFVIQELAARTIGQYSPEEIRERLTAIANAKAVAPVSAADVQRSELLRQQAQLTVDLETISGNMALAASPASFKVVESKFLEAQAKHAAITAKLAALSQQADEPPPSVDDRVLAAERLLNDIGSVTATPAGRLALGRLVDLLECRIGLAFEQVPQGPNRHVSRPVGGVMAFGDNALPAALPEPTDPPDDRPLPIHGPGACGCSDPAVSHTPATTLCPKEAKSTTKGNTG